MLKVIKRPKKRMRAWLRLMRARRGNVAITFAFTLIPLLALVGAAVDFSRANSVRTSLQLAVELDCIDAVEKGGKRHQR